jgi:Domain of unknown function (DUF3597)
MSIFGTILSKLGFSHSSEESNASPAATPAAPETAAEDVATPIAAQETTSSTETTTTTPAHTMSSVDVVNKLETLASNHTESLNWKSSIVDLLKLLSLDSSLTSRKELATELGCPSEKMGDSASMNVWLHKTVLQKLAENGGNVPAALLG